MEWRTHPFHKLIYAPRGSGEVWIGDRSHPFGPRDLIVVPSQNRNRIVDAPGEPVSLYVLCLSRQLLAFDRGVEKRLPVGAVAMAAGQAERVEQQLRRLLYEQRRDDANRALTLVAGTLGLIDLVLSEPSTRERPAPESSMEAYVAHLDKNFFDATTVDVEAERMGLSRRAFTQAFREATGRSWLDYVRDRAIRYACQLLDETPMPIASVAFECGFNDLSTFYRQFKSRTGASPAAWRQRREN